MYLLFLYALVSDSLTCGCELIFSNPNRKLDPEEPDHSHQTKIDNDLRRLQQNYSLERRFLL
ncbi:hypothetical protein [Microcoleus sp. FACHB-68]|uniref:hypothetical protein n=1 Tax=Microcoleus sp. FACHB-68 TaxID=2692826 RepID=UPI001684FAA9|nr:hypothetical protein [Microcoleus sp. FACHB-68]MBD1938952.1 hypothetical protein [Microcoleus sp. FACHB-68]